MVPPPVALTVAPDDGAVEEESAMRTVNAPGVPFQFAEGLNRKL